MTGYFEKLDLEVQSEIGSREWISKNTVYVEHSHNHNEQQKPSFFRSSKFTGRIWFFLTNYGPEPSPSFTFTFIVSFNYRRSKCTGRIWWFLTSYVPEPSPTFVFTFLVSFNFQYAHQTIVSQQCA